MPRYTPFAAVCLVLAACSPDSDPRAKSDSGVFTARAATGAGAGVDDELSMAIEAERLNHQLGTAIVAAGGAPPPEAVAGPSASELERVASGLNGAARRLIVLRDITCRAPPIAKPIDCAAFVPPRWAYGNPRVPKPELQARLHWVEANAYKFVHPACNAAVRRTGNEHFCATE
jgi:hypothetical protein